MINQEKIHEIQVLEQNMQSLLMQKQAFQMELNETESSLEEIRQTGEDVYKLTGQILIKTDKQNLIKELNEKKDIINLRLNSIIKQEKLINDKIDKLRQNPKKAAAEK